MAIRTIIIITFFITIIIGQQFEFVIDDHNIKNNWSVMEKYLKKQTVLDLSRQNLSEQVFLKILNMDLPNLEELHFSRYEEWDASISDLFRSPQILTHTLIEAIFKSSFFSQLKVLNLQRTNIDDRSLTFLEKVNLTTNISGLNLQGCFISAKGFQSLSNIRFNNLKQLNISDTLLVEAEAVDGVIAIICGNSSQHCKNGLEVLDISLTNIMREDFIRLMKRLNPASLRVLDLRKLSLVFKTTYNEGFNYSAFEILAQKFSNLEYLNLQDSFVDDEVAIIFQNTTFPYLLTLNVATNHLTDHGVKLWVKKQNMPNLQVFALHSNEVGDEAINHLVEQNFQFRKLFLGDSRVTAQGIKRINQLSTDRLEKLLLEANIPSEVLNDFFEKGNFPNLKELVFLNNALLTNIFYKIKWGKLQKLQSLAFSSCNLKSSMDSSIMSFQQEKLNIFPNLVSLIISEAQLNDEITTFILITLPFYFPKLHKLYILQSEGLEPATFMLGALSESDFNEGMYININFLQIFRRGNQFELVTVPSINFLIYSQNQEDLKLQALNSKIASYVSAFDFSTLTSITIYSKPLLSFFMRILKEAQITSLQNLRQLNLQMVTDIDFLMGVFADISLPSLRELLIIIVVPGDAQEDYVDKAVQFFERFKNLNSLYLHIAFLNEDNGFILRKKFLDTLYFPRLTEFVSNDQNMEVDQVANFIRNHSRTLRSIHLGNNFMETQFLSILAEEEMVLQMLNLESTSFMVDEFAILGQVNTQFLRYLKFSQSDLTNQHILAFLNQSSRTGQIFPKMTSLDLQSNDIRKQGLSALLATGMYDLLNLNLNKNSNPQFMNIIFTYPTRINLIEADMVEIYGLQDNLHPSSVLRIENIMLKTKSFLQQDFQHLARLNFAKLANAVFQIYNVYDCQVLSDLTKINQWAKLPQFLFINDQTGINSTCLANVSFESHVLGLTIIDEYGTTYLPEFAELLLNTTQDIKFFKLINTRLPPDFFSKIFKKSYFQLEQLVIKSNYIGDTSARQFFKKSYLNLKTIILADVNITDATVETLSLSIMPELEILVLNENKLGVRGIRAIQNKETLIILSLSRCGLDSEALNALGELQMPKLQGIYLSYNDFTGADLLIFVSNIERKSFPNLYYLDLKGIDLSKQEYDAINQVLTPKSIKVVMDRPHYIARVNAARY